MRLPRAALCGTLVLLSTALGFALPWLQTGLANLEVAHLGQTVAQGLALARGTAISKNQRVQFRLNANGSIAIYSETDGQPLPATSAAIRSEHIGIAVNPLGAHLATFNGLGWSVSNADGSPSISSVELEAYTSDQQIRPRLRITLSAAGSVLLCDPGADAAARLACPHHSEYEASSLRLRWADAR